MLCHAAFNAEQLTVSHLDGEVIAQDANRLTHHRSDFRPDLIDDDNTGLLSGCVSPGLIEHMTPQVLDANLVFIGHCLPAESELMLAGIGQDQKISVKSRQVEGHSVTRVPTASGPRGLMIGAEKVARVTRRVHMLAIISIGRQLAPPTGSDGRIRL
jgi:hypothetical protein